MKNFLPTSRQELLARGWDQLDIIIISGDAYLDHPSFGSVLIARLLESQGYKVGIIPQPNWKKNNDFLELGRPRLFFGISAGNMDSMINHYTAQKKIRSEDAYSPQAKMGLRPNRATIVYSQMIKRLFSDIPIVLGGVEASLRRIPHYDFWSDKIRNSILFDAKADILVYGMAEKAITEIASALNNGRDISELTKIKGTVHISKQNIGQYDLGEFKGDYTKQEFRNLSLDFAANYREKSLSLAFAGRYLIHNPPAKPLTTMELDKLYELPFQRNPHPRYKSQIIPAFEQIKNSICSHRGCFGGCNFCSIGLHQGKTIQSRSKQSIQNEIKTVAQQEYFNGTISDVGGPTANMYGMFCKMKISQTCQKSSCLYPEICRYLNTDHRSYKKLLSSIRKMNDVNNVFIASGVRFDLGLSDEQFIFDLAAFYTGGYLKLAPEHKSQAVLAVMNKPAFILYEKFCDQFRLFSRQQGKKQFVIPYIIVGHPGSTLQDTLELALYLKKNNIRLEQVQEFTPTPMTVSTMMYYTQKDLNGNTIHVPKGRELRLMKALIQWYLPQNRKLIIEALQKIKQQKLIGSFLD